EPGVTTTQREKIDRTVLSESVHAAWRRTFLIDVVVPPGDAAQFVRGVQTDDVRPRLPLQHVCIDVDGVAIDDVTGDPPVGVVKGGDKTLRGGRPDFDARSEIFMSKGAITLHADSESAKESAKRDRESTCKQPDQGAQGSQPEQRNQAGNKQ